MVSKHERETDIRVPHLRLEVPEEWLRDEFRDATGFDARKLLDHLVDTLLKLRMPGADDPQKQVPLINQSNLKHAIVPLQYAYNPPGERFVPLKTAVPLPNLKTPATSLPIGGGRRTGRPAS